MWKVKIVYILKLSLKFAKKEVVPEIRFYDNYKVLAFNWCALQVLLSPKSSSCQGKMKHSKENLWQNILKKFKV